MTQPYNSTVLGNPQVSNPLTAAGQTLTLALNSVGNNGALVELWAGAAPAGVQIAFDGSLDGGVTWNVPLGGIRTDTGAIETANNSAGYIAVTQLPSAWRLEVDQLTNVRVRLIGITSGSVNVAIKAGSFFNSQPLTQVSALLAGGSLDTPNALLWELDEIRRVLCDISQGQRTDYKLMPTPPPLPAVYEAGTNT